MSEENDKAFWAEETALNKCADHGVNYVRKSNQAHYTMNSQYMPDAK